MGKTDVSILDITLQKTHIWLKDLAYLMGWEDQQLSYTALRAVLHALRDRLPVEVAAKLGAQLPMLIRGIYYEGWVPAHTPAKIHHLDEFLDLVSFYLGNDFLIPLADSITKSVFKVIENHVSEGEVERLKKVLPQPIAAFWRY